MGVPLANYQNEIYLQGLGGQRPADTPADVLPDWQSVEIDLDPTACNGMRVAPGAATGGRRR